MKRLLLALLALAVAGLAGLEGIARFALGLGDPPLTVRDEEMEYRFKPDQDVRRFGNRVVYNQWSMRSEPIEARKTRANEFRVLVLGDSVINGGALTDQGRLATTLAEHALARSDRPARVLNASAGSWGPENLSAYLRKFGLFDADVVIVVLSTHDMADVMTFPADLGPDFPLQRPLLASAELVTRYLPRYLSMFVDPPQTTTDPLLALRATSQDTIDRSRRALRDLIVSARSGGAAVYVVHHPEREEPVPSDHPLLTELRAVLEDAGLPFLSTAELLGPVGRREPYYRDSIHINELGQELYARVIVCLASAASSVDASNCTNNR
ncbi:MAG: GDSL-type esterase/lipase family protein [Geminicoccaceae bacterium]|nr:GDSL-type esterase/lipase family protein [Geminicoccaceae bacterium]MDW8342720.1 GDSL-type esterase/lipase family protein [Geminicoccaceae bacterium]